MELELKRLIASFIKKNRYYRAKKNTELERKKQKYVNRNLK